MMRAGTFILAGILLAASAYAAPHVDGTAKVPADPSPPSHFTPREDGGFDHAASLGQCPASIAGFRFREVAVFQADGTDVSCQYDGEEDASHMTVYFYQSTQAADAAASAQQAGGAIVQRFPEAEFLSEESESCAMMIDLLHGLTLAAEATTDTTITIGQTPCFIFRLASGVALVTTDKIGPWHLKVRITEIKGETDMSALTMQAANILNFERGVMAGQPASSLE
ncbi:hypothetical protein ACQKH5_07885 [Hyphomonas sp. NPDC076900]|uniref:hypothetical protein n=1 Tax=unclassified Hyphomonas TaxID=2630699 RepID=UPI003CFF2B56